MIKTFFINSTQAQYTDEEFSFIQTQLYNAGIFGDPVTGVLGLSVTENSPQAMSVLASAGKALLSLTKAGVTWNVIVINTASQSVTIPANSSGSNRVDAIIVRVDKDAEPNTLKTNVGTIELVQGTGVSALSDGAITTAVGSDGWYRLANVTVVNGASTIANTSIADTRSKVITNESVSVKDNYSSAVPVGTISPYAGRSAPSQFLLCDGSAVSRSTYANLFSILAPSAVFTVTIASPAVFTKVAHGLMAGDKLHFTTTGGLPAGLAINTTYYVLSSGLTADAFKVALSPEGTVVNTSGSQNGVHTFYISNFGKGDGSTTFTLPDLRSRSVVGRGNSAPTTTLDFESGAVDTGTDIVTLPSFSDFPYQGQKIRLTTTGTLPTGLSAGVDYYVIRISSTQIALASSPANADGNGQDSSPIKIDLTGAGSGVHTIIYTQTSKLVLGLIGGEETHRISIAELASHAHSGKLGSPAGGGGGSSSAPQTAYSSSTGGDTDHNNMSPFVQLNFIIRY